MKYILLTLIIINPLFAISKSIYGKNDRINVHNHQEVEWQRRAFSTCSMIHPDLIRDLEGENEGFSLIFGATYKETKNLCPGVKFEHQLAAASCSGFLIAPDLIATAGHCIDKHKGCNGNKWVFGFHQRFEVDLTSTKAILAGTDNIYECKNIIRRKEDFWGNDYAVIQLDRPVENYSPLKIRRSGKIAKNTGVVIIGNPSGLPTKIAGNAKVTNNWSGATFTTNLDSFAGNSGSAVFNAETGMVEGILVRGWRWSFTHDKTNDCYYPTVRPQTSGDEVVTRITRIIPGSPELELPQDD